MFSDTGTSDHSENVSRYDSVLIQVIKKQTVLHVIRHLVLNSECIGLIKKLVFQWS